MSCRACPVFAALCRMVRFSSQMRFLQRQSLILTVSLAASTCKDAAAPPDTGPLRFVRISAGFSHTCALTVSGKAYCWGYDNYYQLGMRLNDNPPGFPLAVPGGHLFKSISTGWLYTCGITLDGRAYCWGGSYYGAVGPIPQNYTCDGVPCVEGPNLAGGSNRFQDVVAGDTYTCGRLIDQNILCWGTLDGLMGGNGPYLSISAGFPGCAITLDSLGYCWGPNERGRHPGQGDDLDAGRTVPYRRRCL